MGMVLLRSPFPRASARCVSFFTCVSLLNDSRMGVINSGINGNKCYRRFCWGTFPLVNNRVFSLYSKSLFSEPGLLVLFLGESSHRDTVLCTWLSSQRKGWPSECSQGFSLT